MASGKQFDDLPNEVLLKIFTYLNIEELVVSTQNVCMRWREVSRDNKLWKNAVFNPRKVITDEEVVWYLENMPALRSYSATRRTGNIVIDALCNSCTNIRSIDLHELHNMNIPLMQKIIQHFPLIESLKVPLPVPVFREELIKFAEVIGQCQSLRSLSLNGFSVSDRVGSEAFLLPIADGCPSLQHMHLGYHVQLDEDLQNLLQKKRHQLLSFSCKILTTKNIARHISECTTLQHLEIYNRSEDLLYDDIQSLTKLTNLKYFALRYCTEDVVNNLPMFFLSGSLSQVVHLDLSLSYPINDITVAAIIENFPQLQHLDISGNDNLQGEGLRYIGKCVDLQHLDLSSSVSLYVEGVRYIGKCVHLQHLKLSRALYDNHLYIRLRQCLYISVTLRDVIGKCVHLQHLDLRMNDILQDEALRYIGKCVHLQHLDLSMCSDLTDSSMEYVGAGCRSLKKLDISQCEKMTDKAIEHVVKCTELQVLNVNYNDVRGSCFHLISTHLQQLAELHLENCKYLNKVYVDELHKEMVHLKIIRKRIF